MKIVVEIANLQYGFDVYLRFLFPVHFAILVIFNKGVSLRLGVLASQLYRCKDTVLAILVSSYFKIFLVAMMVCALR